MTKHTTKALNTLLIFAILCAFCITPAAAATATENVPIIFSKRIYGVDGIEYLVYDLIHIFLHPLWDPSAFSAIWRYAGQMLGHRKIAQRTDPALWWTHEITRSDWFR